MRTSITYMQLLYIIEKQLQTTKSKTCSHCFTWQEYGSPCCSSSRPYSLRVMKQQRILSSGNTCLPPVAWRPSGSPSTSASSKKVPSARIDRAVRYERLSLLLTFGHFERNLFNFEHSFHPPVSHISELWYAQSAFK